MIQNLCGPLMSQNILKRREDMGRDLLWHTHCVTTRMVCKAYESVQMCRFYNFQNMTQFIGGGDLSFVYEWTRKFLEMYNLIREAYKDKAMFGCSNQLQVFIRQILKTKCTKSNSGAFCACSVLRAQHNKLLSMPSLHTCACLDIKIYTLAEVLSCHLEY
jgi:hypothetical protein